MSGVLNVDTIADNAGTGPVTLTKQSAAKVWYQFNQDTPAVQDSFNVSSITDNSSGVHTVNRTNNMSSDDYACTGMTNAPHYVCFEDNHTEKTAGSISTSLTKFANYEHDATATDMQIISTVTHGDLA